MKKKYIAPELEKLIFEVTDIITESIAGSEGDNEGDGDNWFGRTIYTGTDVIIPGLTD